MSSPEQRRTERLMLSIPVRVIGFDTATGEFTEDTHTTVVNRAGARIALTHRVAVNGTVRVVNLENYSEADFRVVSPTSWTGSEVKEWGVECLEAERNIWGIEFSPPLANEAGALIECRGCRSQGFWALTPVETEALEVSGAVQHSCMQCGKPTYWTFADVSRRPKEFPPAEALQLPPPTVPKKAAEKRVNKRMGMKLPVLVRGPKGEQEICKTENISKGGLGVSLAMDLAVGDVVSVACPYTPGGQNIEQKAEVRRRGQYPFGGMRLYGLGYLR